MYTERRYWRGVFGPGGQKLIVGAEYLINVRSRTVESMDQTIRFRQESIGDPASGARTT